MSERTSCELPEGGPQSLVQLSSQRQRRPNDSEQNVYLPLTTFLDQPISPPATFAANEISQPEIPATNENSTRQIRQFTPDFPEEPPPAYNDLFPDGFQQLNESQELATTDASSNALQVSTNEGSNRADSDIIQVEANADRIQVDSAPIQPVANQNDPFIENSDLATLSNLDSATSQQLVNTSGAATNEANITRQQVKTNIEEAA